MSSNNAEEVDTGEIKNFIKLNFVVSVSLIILIFSISSLNNNPLISVIALPIIFILTYYEERANFITTFYSKYIYLFNSLGMVIIVIFWILPFFGILQFLFLTLSFSRKNGISNSKSACCCQFHNTIVFLLPNNRIRIHTVHN